MLQTEFQDRVGMVVTPTEYQAIEVVYNASDLLKDDFCKAWKKMNAVRIRSYKAHVKRLHEQQKLNARLWRLLEKYAPKDYLWKEKNYVLDTLNTGELKAVRKAKLFDTDDLSTKNIGELLYNIRIYLKMID